MPPEWQAVTIAGIVISALFLLIMQIAKTKLEKRIQLKFDTKLEALRSSFRIDEAKIKSTLEENHAQLEILRQSALSGLSQRHTSISKRQLIAVENVWNSVVSISKAKPLLEMTRHLHMDAALKEAEREDSQGEAMRHFATEIWKTFGYDGNGMGPSVSKERPFISLQSWAFFSAYSSIFGFCVTEWITLKTGTGSKILNKQPKILDLLKTVLPHQTNYIDEQGKTALPYLVDEIEDLLLDTLKKEMLNSNMDHASLAQATEIIRAAEKLSQSLQEDKLPKVPKRLRTAEA